ncbi:MAG TPA: allophanate hydrolase, partial [Cellulomonas sp.]|nr:allophanate hydrolase [Cellulomonas sp.]
APAGLDPVVARIIGAAGALPAHRYAGDLVTLAELRVVAEAGLGDADALLLPTTTHHPTLADVAAEPVAVNSRLGTYTNFCNLFGYAAVAVPVDAGVPGERVGVSVLTRGGADGAALDLAGRLLAAAGPGAWEVLDGAPSGPGADGAAAAGALAAGVAGARGPVAVPA